MQNVQRKVTCVQCDERVCHKLVQRKYGHLPTKSNLSGKLLIHWTCYTIEHCVVSRGNHSGKNPFIPKSCSKNIIL